MCPIIVFLSCGNLAIVVFINIFSWRNCFYNRIASRFSLLGGVLTCICFAFYTNYYIMLHSILFHYVQSNRIHVYDMLNQYNCVRRGRPAVKALFNSGTRTCESKALVACFTRNNATTDRTLNNRTMPGNMFSKPSACSQINSRLEVNKELIIACGGQVESELVAGGVSEWTACKQAI